MAELQRDETPVSPAAHGAVSEKHAVISVNVAAEVAAATKAGRYAPSTTANPPEEVWMPGKGGVPEFS